MKCKKVIKLQIGKDGIVSIETNSDAQKHLEILHRGMVIRSYVIESDGDFSSNFSDDFRVNSHQFIIPKNDVSDLFTIDRFFDFRVVIAGQPASFGSLQVFETLPNCANKQTGSIDFETKIETIEPENPYILPDIDTVPISDAESELDTFYKFITKKHNYNGFS